nr:RNA-directed DNA polymerase, eukaryota [Tanacetum cinerariifolium]
MKLSKWKMKALSIDGRLTLLKSVLGLIPTFYMSIFRAPSSVLHILESIRSRFFNGHEKDSLLAKVVRAIHGDDINKSKVNKLGAKFCWSNIVKEIRVLSNQGVKVLDYMRLKLGNGEMAAIWADNWGGAEQVQFNALLDMISSINLVPMADRWVWTLENSGDFSVASIREKIDKKRLPIVFSKTRWVRYVPIKVNVLAWKIKIDALPTRQKISRRGIDIQSITCPVCDNGVESLDHLFFRCCLARQISRKIATWWNVQYVEVDSHEEWLAWLASFRLAANLKRLIEGVFYVSWWSIWTYHNKLLFDDKAHLKESIFDNIVSNSSYWCSSRWSQFMEPNPVEVIVDTNSRGNILVTDINHKIIFKVKPCNTYFHQQRLLLHADDRPIAMLRDKMHTMPSSQNVRFANEKFKLEVFANVDSAFVAALIAIVDAIKSSTNRIVKVVTDGVIETALGGFGV